MRNKKILLCFVIVLCCIFIIIFPLILIKVSFKINYIDVIEENLMQFSENSQLNENLVLAVIKAESNFNENAVSSANAYGLMQLQFATAKEMANEDKLMLADLFNPNINISLGIKYLNYLFSMFEDKQLVLISYNAGPNRVKEWMNNNQLYVKNGQYITPYKETTNYLNKVLLYEEIYKKIRG